jgi:hypothetical protein
MRTAVLLIFIFLQISCISKRQNDANLLEVGRKKGTYKGYYSIQNILRTKVFTKEFSLSSHAPGQSRGSTGNYIDGLATMLGEYDGVGANNKAQQAIPNSTNVLIWYLSMSNVAESIFEHCKIVFDQNTSAQQSVNSRFETLSREMWISIHQNLNLKPGEALRTIFYRSQEQTDSRIFIYLCLSIHTSYS